MRKVKNVVILGSTGSIGVNTLKVIERFPDAFKVVGLSAYNSLPLLEKQIRQFRPTYVAVPQKGLDYFRKRGLGVAVKFLDVESELERLVSMGSIDIVIIAMRSSSALGPFLTALRHVPRVAPANKEALVIGGKIIMKEARKYGAQIIPIDSEQSAIFQCLHGQDRRQLRKVYLTASGGTLRDVPQSRFNRLSVREMLNHPTWKMGKKITIDCATLMNKGFEVIEAIHLFDLTADEIEVVIHPESVIHSMVEFKDGSIIAQLGIPDMRLPIQYALTYPERMATGLKETNFFKLGQLRFMNPDLQKFPALALAFYIARKGGTLPAVLNACDEEAVEAYLNGKIKFTQVYKTVEKVVLKHKITIDPKLADILAADRWAREEARKFIYGGFSQPSAGVDHHLKFSN